MRKKSGRPQKLGDLIQRELSDLVQRELRDPRVGMITITDVDVFAYADGQSRIDLDFTDVKGAHITATSKFLITGAGRSQVAVQSGIFADQVSECWDPTYCRTYIKDNAGWTNPPCAGAFCELGSVGSCPVVH